MNNLISAADIKRLTTVSENASDKKLAQAVPDAEQMHLRPLLGSDLYTELLALVATAPEPPVTTGLSAAAEAQATATYQAALDTWRTANASPLLTLWNAVKPCLAQWALVEAWPALLVHVEEAGVNVKTGNANGTTQADAALLGQVWQSHRAKAIWRGDELVSWLESKKNDYAAYRSIQPLPSGRQPIDYCGGISLD
jgi:hypothetical protein